MRTIRLGVFETNSSSCHAVTICGENKLRLFKDNKVVALIRSWYDTSDDTIKVIVPDQDFIPIEQIYKDIIAFIENTSEKVIDDYNRRAAVAIVNACKDLKDFEEFMFNPDRRIQDYYSPYDMKSVLEEIYDSYRVFWNDGDTEFNIFLVNDGGEDKDDLSGIEGPIATISGTLCT